MSGHFVVVFDPAGIECEGELLAGNRAEVARSKGVVLLPVDVDVLRRSAFAGWAKRAFGRGWQYDPNKGSRGCPLMLHASPQFPIIHWAARIVRDPELGALNGSLRLAPDTAQLGAHAAGLAPESPPIQVVELPPVDGTGGWIVGGRARATIPADMNLALQLYGTLAGARVQWFAASQST